ncbi:MAG: S-layer homology domain-containing protein [Lachnospiraceae bacterium]|nr:S-layer homology domain-containing protein [Lachnospiraceae bacterium]
MKKILYVLMTILVVSVFGNVPVSAAGDALSLSISTDSSDLTAEGADIAVKVVYSGSASVGALSGSLAYESDKVSFISAAAYGEGEDGTEFSVKDSTGSLGFVWADADEAPSGTTVFTFFFSIKEGASSASFSIDSASLKACRASGDDVVYFSIGAGSKVSQTFFSITLQEKTATLSVGDTAELPAAKVVSKISSASVDVTWSSSDTSVLTVDSSAGTMTAVKAGTATLTAALSKQGVSDTCAVTVEKNKVTLTESMVSLAYTNKLYTGEALKPEVTVKDGTETLTAGTDYSVAYSNNVNVGKATVTVKGKNDYEGTVSLQFQIVAKAITSSMIGAIADQTYTGSAVEPALTVTYGSRTLAAGSDYTVSYSSNTAVGTATALVSGQGNYAGTAKKTFKIVEGAQSTGSFPDVADSGLYYYDAVYWAVGKGITLGRGGYFQPDSTCTRAEAVTFLYRMAGEPEVSDDPGFKDVYSSDYYYKPVAWAVKNGITNGYSTDTFAPSVTCSRAMIVTLIYRYVNQLGGDTSISSGAPTFPDVPLSGKWYSDPVRWAADKGITLGRSDGKFYPDESCTRAQIVTFLYRYSKL